MTAFVEGYVSAGQRVMDGGAGLAPGYQDAALDGLLRQRVESYPISPDGIGGALGEIGLSRIYEEIATEYLRRTGQMVGPIRDVRAHNHDTGMEVDFITWEGPDRGFVDRTIGCVNDTERHLSEPVISWLGMKAVLAGREAENHPSSHMRAVGVLVVRGTDA